MQKIKNFCSSEYFTWLLVAIGTLGILIYYVKNVPYMNAVWELVDEYGYLANAAYLSGKDWGYFTNMYYGYGYSLWLIPVFWLAKTGMQVIKGAVLINTMFIVFTFWVQIVLFSKIYKTWNRNVIVLISFALCFQPYLIANDMKVNCECLLTFMIWLCGLLMYQAISTEKWYYFTLSAVAVAYTFFVHTRAFVFLAAFFLFFGIMLLLKKVKIRNFLAFVVPFFMFFILGYMLKNHLIDVIYSNELFYSTSTSITNGGTTQVEIGNTLSVSYVFKKMINTLTNITPIHLYSLACKCFYLFVGTAGMFYVGLFTTFTETIVEWRTKKSIGLENGLKMMYAIAAIVMVLALVINSPGHLDMTPYFFYGRYYEYLVGPMIFLGLGYCTENKIKIRAIIGPLLVLLVSFWFTMDLADILETQEFYFDSNRIPAFSLITKFVFYYRAVMRYSLILTLGVLLAMIVINYSKRLRCLIPIVLLTVFLLNGHVITKNTISMHGPDNHYYAIASYLHTNCEKREIYFVNADEIRTSAYAGIQSLLINQKLVLIEPTNLDIMKSGDWFVSFQVNNYLKKWDKPFSKIAETSWFVIYEVE